MKPSISLPGCPFAISTRLRKQRMDRSLCDILRRVGVVPELHDNSGIEAPITHKWVFGEVLDWRPPRRHFRWKLGNGFSNCYPIQRTNGSF